MGGDDGDIRGGGGWRIRRDGVKCLGLFAFWSGKPAVEQVY